MNAVLKASLALVALVTVLNVAFILSGLHETNLVLTQLLFLVLVIAIDVGVVFWGLRMTASENGYGRQLLNAALIGAIGGVMILVVSALLLTVVFPGYLDEVKAAGIDLIESQTALSGQQKDAQVTRLQATTPLSSAVQGCVGTFFTSLVGGAIIGIFQRRR